MVGLDVGGDGWEGQYFVLEGVGVFLQCLFGYVQQWGIFDNYFVGFFVVNYYQYLLLFVDVDKYYYVIFGVNYLIVVVVQCLVGFMQFCYLLI